VLRCFDAARHSGRHKSPQFAKPFTLKVEIKDELSFSVSLRLPIYTNEQKSCFGHTASLILLSDGKVFCGRQTDGQKETGQ